MAVEASAAGNHFHESVFSDAESTTEFSVAERVRFDMHANAELSLELFNGSVQLLHNGSPLIYMGTSQNLSGSGVERGWLQAGTYVLDVDLGVAAFSNQSGSDEQSGSLGMELRFLAVADYDVDGDVDAIDLTLFEDAWGQAEDEADVNADGTIDAQDASLFDAAWQAAQT